MWYMFLFWSRCRLYLVSWITIGDGSGLDYPQNIYEWNIDFQLFGTFKSVMSLHCNCGRYNHDRLHDVLRTHGVLNILFYFVRYFTFHVLEYRDISLLSIIISNENFPINLPLANEFGLWFEKQIDSWNRPPHNKTTHYINII